MAAHALWGIELSGAGQAVTRRGSPALVAIDAATRGVIWRRSLDFDPFEPAVGRGGVWASGGRCGDLVALRRTVDGGGVWLFGADGALARIAPAGA